MSETKNNNEQKAEAAADEAVVDVDAAVMDPVEQALGISAFRSPTVPGFAAVSKARYSDFCVHEVGVGGAIARLESMEPQIMNADNGDSNDNRKKKETPVPLPQAVPVPAVGEDTEESNRKRKHEEVADAPKEEEKKKAAADTSEKEGGDWAAIQTELQAFFSDDDNTDSAGQKAAVGVVTFLQKLQSGSSSSPSSPANGGGDAGEEEQSKQQQQQQQQYVELPPANDKQKRRDLHQWIRSRLSFCALADTIDRNDGGKDNKIIRIWHVSFETKMPNYKKFFDRGANNNSRNNNNNNRNPRNPRPPPGKKYLQFVLYKENTDTTAAIRDIQRRSGGGGGRGGGRGGRYGGRGGRGGRGRHQQMLRIGFAGNKDKRGITSQFVTVPAMTNLASLCSWNRHAGGHGRGGGGHTRGAGASVIRVGNFMYTSDELQLGRLQGNHFEVVFRNVQVAGSSSDRAAAKSRLETAASAIREHGFINYFGVQRFGKFHDTHLTGISALKGDFEKAVDIIMQSKEGEREDTLKLRETWRDRFQNVPDTKDARAAAEKECAAKLARQFHRSMTAEVAIIQSLASSPLDYRRAFSSIPRTLRMMFVHAMQSYIWNKASSHRMQMASSSGNFHAQVGDLVLELSSDGSSLVAEGLPTVKTLTAEDIETNKYTLEDVVLPLIGTKTRNPENECGALLDKLLQEQGVTLEMMKNVKDRDLHCLGDYRKLLCRPKDVEYKIVEYTDPLQPLLQTDLMKLNNIEVETVVNNGETKNGEEKKDPLLGLVVGFSLPSSSYATIFMRELMKRPTSSEFQRELKLE